MLTGRKFEIINIDIDILVQQLEKLNLILIINEKVLNEATTSENAIGIFVLDRLTKEH